MKRIINKIKLYVKKSNYAKEIADDLKKKLIKNGFTINNKEYDLAISIGGDGTFLKMVHENKFNDNILYFGINAGSLGFLTSIESKNLDSFVRVISKNNFFVRDSILINTSFITKRTSKEYCSINEIVIKKSNHMLLKSNIYINNELLEKYVGDGLLISTPNGSTAYNLSFDGVIIDNDLKALTLVPIAPINNTIYKTLSKKIVFADNKVISVKLDNEENICMINDGIISNINEVCEIKIKISNKIIKVLEIDDDFIKKINTKLIG